MSSLNSSHWTSTFCLFIWAFFLFLFTPAHILVQVLIRVGGERDLTLGESTIIEMCLRHHIWVCGCTRCVCLCVCMCALCQLWLASGTLDVRVKDTFTLQAQLCLSAVLSLSRSFFLLFCLSALPSLLAFFYISLPPSILYPPLGSSLSDSVCCGMKYLSVLAGPRNRLSSFLFPPPASPPLLFTDSPCCDHVKGLLWTVPDLPPPSPLALDLHCYLALPISSANIELCIIYGIEHTNSISYTIFYFLFFKLMEHILETVSSHSFSNKSG